MWQGRYFPAVETLLDRIVPAVTATFAPDTGVLTVFGDAQANSIIVSRNVGGDILINGGAVAIQGGAPTTANTTLIKVFGLGGSDEIKLDEANGDLPVAKLHGGGGRDTMEGGAGNDTLVGGSGNDSLVGNDGFDSLLGGRGDDTLTGCDHNDQAFGQSGDDLMIWNPGDDDDLNEGGGGDDTVRVNGGSGAEDFAVTPNVDRVRFDRLSPNPFFIDIGTSEHLEVNAGGGDDTVTGNIGLAPLISLSVDGGTGKDLIRAATAQTTWPAARETTPSTATGATTSPFRRGQRPVHLGPG